MLVACAGSAALGFAGRRAFADEAVLARLAVAAEREPPVELYDASPQDRSDEMFRAFHARYPRIRVSKQRFVGGAGIASRIVQETQAGQPTGDVAVIGADQVFQLTQRALLRAVDADALDIPAGLRATPYAVTIGASVHLLLYNRTLVSEADAPRGWEDLLAPRWHGRVGLLAAPTSLAHLAKPWGEARARAYAERLAAQQPLLFRSSHSIAVAAGAGEVPAASVTYQGAQTGLQAGAPVVLVFPDPVPVNSFFAVVPRQGRAPSGAQVLVAWLASREGALATEAATFRGVPVVHDTNTARMIRGRSIAEYAPAETETYARILNRITAIIRAGGRDAP